jgi:hypothetical protein
VTAKRVQFWLTLLWAIQLPIVFVMPESWRVPYLIVCSVYANFVGHWAAYEAAKAASEARQT